MEQETFTPGTSCYFDLMGNKRLLKQSVVADAPSREKTAEELYRLFGGKENSNFRTG